MESVIACMSKQFEDFDVSSFGESMDKQRATLAYDVGCVSLSSTMLGEAIGDSLYLLFWILGLTIGSHWPPRVASALAIDNCPLRRCTVWSDVGRPLKGGARNESLTKVRLSFLIKIFCWSGCV